MKIAVLGAGNVGVPLAKAFAGHGHDVSLANSRGPETIETLAAAVGATATFAADAVQGAETIILSVNLQNYEQIRPLLADVPDSVPIIDTGNYHPRRDGLIAPIENGQIEAHWISEQLGRPVAKAWTTAISQTIAEGGLPAGSPGRIALSIAGDEPHARQLAAELTDLTGFDPVDIGGLENTWRTQPGTSAYCTELPLEAMKAAIDHADRVHAPTRRDVCWDAFGTFSDEELTRESIVRFHRAVTLTPDPS